MAAKAQEISMEAGSKMAAAMKDVITAAAGISSFAIESARDLVQYMVRRGQMTQDEADKLIREVEEAQAKRGARAAPPAVPAAAKQPAAKSATKTAAPRPEARAAAKAAAKPASKPVPARKAPAAAKKPAARSGAAAKKSASKTKRR
jgi:hypothetical protein